MYIHELQIPTLMRAENKNAYFRFPTDNLQVELGIFRSVKFMQVAVTDAASSELFGPRSSQHSCFMSSHSGSKVSGAWSQEAAIV